MFPLLSLIIFLPLIGGIAILFLPKEQESAIRWTALGVAWANLMLVIGLVLGYAQVAVAGANSTFLFNEHLTWISALGINYSLGIDGISLLLVALTALLTVVCIAASFRIEQKVKNYMAFMLLLESGIIGVFLSTNLFLFYVFWEVMLIPAYFLVGSWGGERRILDSHSANDATRLASDSGRVQGSIYAAFKFVLYTSVGSLLMLAGIIALGYYHQQAAAGCSYTLDLATLLSKTDSSGHVCTIGSGVQTWLLLAFAAAFAVKIPFVPLPYGFLRFCLPLFPSAVQTLAPLFNTLAVVGILYCALLALVQTDIKRLLGYSSISHLGIVMLGMFAFNAQGIEGSVLQMVNHGITTAALFLIAGFIEARAGTRRLSDFGGLATRIPILATVMLIAVLSSLGLPGLNSFAGEFLALLGVFISSNMFGTRSIIFGILGTAVVVPAAWYLIRFFLGMMEGPPQTEGPVAALESRGVLSDIHLGEFMLLLPLLILIFYIGVQPAPLTFLLEPSVTNIINTLLGLGSV